MAGQGSHRNTTILGFKGIYYISPVATVSHSQEDRKKADIICDWGWGWGWCWNYGNIIPLDLRLDSDLLYEKTVMDRLTGVHYCNSVNQLQFSGPSVLWSPGGLAVVLRHYNNIYTYMSSVLLQTDIIYLHNMKRWGKNQESFLPGRQACNIFRFYFELSSCSHRC